MKAMPSALTDVESRIRISAQSVPSRLFIGTLSEQVLSAGMSLASFVTYSLQMMRAPSCARLRLSTVQDASSSRSTAPGAGLPFCVSFLFDLRAPRVSFSWEFGPFLFYDSSSLCVFPLTESMRVRDMPDSGGKTVVVCVGPDYSDLSRGLVLVAFFSVVPGYEMSVAAIARHDGRDKGHPSAAKKNNPQPSNPAARV